MQSTTGRDRYNLATMDKLTWLFVFVIVETFLPAIKSQTLTLEGHPEKVFVNSTLLLTCKTPSSVRGVTWRKTENGSSEKGVCDQILQNGSCTTNPTQLPNYFECFCNSSSVFSCAIKTLNASNNGEKWRCFASIANQIEDSNYHTIYISNYTADGRISKNGWTDVCIIGLTQGIIMLVSVLIYVVVLVILRFKHAQCREECKQVCCSFIGCLFLIVVGVFVVIVAVIIVGRYSKERYSCEEGWSTGNIVAIVFGFAGIVLLITMCVATIIALEFRPKTATTEVNNTNPTQKGGDTPRLMDLVKDLHYGLVFSHIYGFMEYVAKDMQIELIKNAVKYKIPKDLIYRFLLVIPENCELVLPKEGEYIRSLKIPTLKLKLHQIITMDYAGEKGVYKLTIYKLQMNKEEYYIIAQVPSVLIVISQLSKKIPENVESKVHKFQQLYNNILEWKGWSNTVQIVVHKDKEDIVDALFAAATRSSPPNQAFAISRSHVEFEDKEDIGDALFAAATRSSPPNQAFAISRPHVEFEGKKDGERRVHSAKSQTARHRSGSQHRSGQELLTLEWEKRETSIPAAGDVIPGLAWDYVQNYLMTNLTDEFRRSYLQKLNLACESIQTLIIVWVKSCNIKTCWRDLANTHSSKRHVKEHTCDTFDPKPGQPLKWNVFTFTDTERKLERCFIADYCTPMQCIKMIEADYAKMSSTAMQEQGPRFKAIFDKIVSEQTIKQRLGEVSLIYFDDISPDCSLIDLLEEHIPFDQ